jgi:hypothetical protein
LATGFGICPPLGTTKAQTGAARIPVSWRKSPKGLPVCDRPSRSSWQLPG